jgi:hypothetical protein
MRLHVYRLLLLRRSQQVSNGAVRNAAEGKGLHTTLTIAMRVVNVAVAMRVYEVPDKSVKGVGGLRVLRSNMPSTKD